MGWRLRLLERGSSALHLCCEYGLCESSRMGGILEQCWMMSGFGCSTEHCTLFSLVNVIPLVCSPTTVMVFSTPRIEL